MQIAFISNPAVQCGVSQFGIDTVAALQAHSCHEITVYTLANREDFEASFAAIAEADIALYNYHSITLGFLTRSDIIRTKKPSIGLLHDFDYVDVHAVCSDIFRYRIVPDPSLVSRLPGLWTVPRIVPQTPVKNPDNDVFTIGTFGLAVRGKNCDEIISFASRHFERARVRLHVPKAFYGSEKEMKEMYASFLNRYSDRIDVKVSSDYLTQDELILFLAQNDLNLFLYDKDRGTGLSSVLDYAVSSERPMALSDSGMFRHFRYFAPELFLCNSSLQHILEVGSDLCRRLKKQWTPQNAAKVYDAIFDEVIEDYARPHIQKVNTVLTDDFRDALHSQEETMRNFCSEMFARKIPRANVQQAFVLNQVEKYVHPGDSILCVGYNEDTAFFTLKTKGYVMDAIDPEFDVDLSEFFDRYSGKRYYNVIFATSALEHVKNDEEFIYQVTELLAPGGVAILTMDFKDNYVQGDILPTIDHLCTNFRFYTTKHILRHLLPQMHRCRLLDIPDWNMYPPDFELGGCLYGFATLIFQKNASFPNDLELAYETQLRELSVQDSLKNKYQRRLVLALRERICSPSSDCVTGILHALGCYLRKIMSR